MTRKDSPILILGGGAWGLSTALHMLNSGYVDITVIERAECIPSRYSAAWDLDKIVRAEYEDAFYTELALVSTLFTIPLNRRSEEVFLFKCCFRIELTLGSTTNGDVEHEQDAMEGWKTPLFGPYYHQTEKALSSISSHPTFAPEIKQLNGSKDFKDHTWQYTGPLTGFRGYFNRIAGYAHSADTLKGIWEHCASRGVKFIMGEEAGKAVELLYDDATAFASSSTGTGPQDGNKKGRCIGVKTSNGKRHLANLTICALGAYGASLVPSLGRFTVARCWSVAHVQLTEAETDYLRGIPTTNIRDLGFFFEPDPKTRLFKLCPLGTGYTNTNGDGISLPPGDRLPPPQDYIPLEDEQKLRQLLRETFPWMAKRPFVEQKLCWFADTADSEYCIDFVPDTDDSLVVLSGDSGHGFKMMPIFGKWVVDLLEKGGQNHARWQWRHTDLRGQDWGTSVSWRIGKSGELRELMTDQSNMIKARL